MNKPTWRNDWLDILKETQEKLEKSNNVLHIEEGNRMKEIEINVDVGNLYNNRLSDDGGYLFDIFAITDADGDFEQAIEAYSKLFDAEILASLNLTIDVRHIFIRLHEFHSHPDGTVPMSSKELFDGLRNNCQWIVEEIDKIEWSND
jgi:hypothetical protein